MKKHETTECTEGTSGFSKLKIKRWLKEINIITMGADVLCDLCG